MKIAVINTKGGVGKSTFAMQLVAPYYLSRFNSSYLFEVDDYNFDASDYNKSMIHCGSIPIGSEADKALEEIRMKISGKHAVIDVGGNETAGAFLNAAGQNHLGRKLDAIIIPVSQTGKDVENAGKTIEMVKEHLTSFNGKIVLGVTRIPADYGIKDLQYRLPDLVELAERSGCGILTLPNDHSIPLSRTMGLTAWELATFSDDHIDAIQGSMIDEEEKGDDADQDVLRRLNRYTVTIESAIRLKPHLEERFQHLDKILGVTADMTTDGLASATEAGSAQDKAESGVLSE